MGITVLCILLSSDLPPDPETQEEGACDEESQVDGAGATPIPDQDQSLPATETSYSGPSGDEADASSIRWQDVGMPAPSSHSRRHVHSATR